MSRSISSSGPEHFCQRSNCKPRFSDGVLFTGRVGTQNKKSKAVRVAEGFEKIKLSCRFSFFGPYIWHFRGMFGQIAVALKLINIISI